MLIPALTKTYNGKIVLDIPETEVPDGTVTAICGSNGSGKSTLAKILTGILKDDNGRSSIPGINVGYMCQISLPFRMSVKRNLLLNAQKGLSKSEKQSRADALLSSIGLSEISSKNAVKLSGGQVERMALARILMKDYDLLILDEPTASMDQASIPAAEKMISEYRERTGCTILLITHSPEQAQRMSSSVIALEDGKIRDY